MSIKSKKMVVHCKKAKYDIYIGRPSVWGNPFTHLPHAVKEGMTLVKDREEAIARYKEWILSQPQMIEDAKICLRGMVLGCWCDPLACHGHVLAEIANAEEPETKET